MASGSTERIGAASSEQISVDVLVENVNRGPLIFNYRSSSPLKIWVDQKFPVTTNSTPNPAEKTNWCESDLPRSSMRLASLTAVHP